MGCVSHLSIFDPYERDDAFLAEDDRQSALDSLAHTMGWEGNHGRFSPPPARERSEPRPVAPPARDVMADQPRCARVHPHFTADEQRVQRAVRCRALSNSNVVMLPPRLRLVQNNNDDGPGLHPEAA